MVELCTRHWRLIHWSRCDSDQHPDTDMTIGRILLMQIEEYNLEYNAKFPTCYSILSVHTFMPHNSRVYDGIMAKKRLAIAERGPFMTKR